MSKIPSHTAIEFTLWIALFILQLMMGQKYIIQLIREKKIVREMICTISIKILKT